jgi:hypothetical protein
MLITWDSYSILNCDSNSWQLHSYTLGWHYQQCEKLRTPPKSPKYQMPSHMIFALGLHFLLVQKFFDITFWHTSRSLTLLHFGLMVSLEFRTKTRPIHAYLSMKEGCLFVLFVNWRSPKPQNLLLHCWYHWKARVGFIMFEPMLEKLILNI